MKYPISMVWRDTVFLSFYCDAQKIQSQLPSNLTIDLFEGKGVITIAFLSIENFNMKGIPSIFSSTFPECNIRTYVTYNNQKGVYFFSLDTDSMLEILGARLFFSLNYRYRKIHKKVDNNEYFFEEKKWGEKAYSTQFHAKIGPRCNPSSLDHFVFDRSIYFVKKGKKTYQGKVIHENWKFQDVEVLEFKSDLLSPFTNQEIVSALYSRKLQVSADFIALSFKPIFFFDDDCGLCNLFIRILLKVDVRKNFLFAPIGKATFIRLCKKAPKDQAVLLEEDRLSFGSKALLKCVQYLPWYLKFVNILYLVPSALLDKAYRLIAKNRKKCPFKKSPIDPSRLLP